MQDIFNYYSDEVKTEIGRKINPWRQFLSHISPFSLVALQIR